VGITDSHNGWVRGRGADDDCGGKLVGGIEMVLGISLISLLTAAVTSTVIQRGERAAKEEDRIRDEQTRQAIVAGLAQLDDRLSRIESELRKA
jgi:hypothetical protein